MGRQGAQKASLLRGILGVLLHIPVGDQQLQAWHLTLLTLCCWLFCFGFSFICKSCYRSGRTRPQQRLRRLRPRWKKRWPDLHPDCPNLSIQSAQTWDDNIERASIPASPLRRPAVLLWELRSYCYSGFVHKPTVEVERWWFWGWCAFACVCVEAVTGTRREGVGGAQCKGLLIWASRDGWLWIIKHR